MTAISKQNKFAVSINGKIEVVYADTTVVEKQGKKQFWFYDNGRRHLAVKEPYSAVYKVN